MSLELFHGYTPIASGNQLFLERPRVNRLLEKAVQKQIVTVLAGAGYGKTRSVRAFTKAAGILPCWVSLSERDNREERFWETFTAAVSAGDRKKADKLRAVNFPATDRQFEKYLALYKSDIFRGEYLFVFDDLHFITGKAVLYFLERCAAAPIPNSCLLLISRKEIPFITAKPALRKNVNKITCEELRFTRDEMVSYFHLQRVNPTPQMASAVYRDTEGWPFAIHLAGLSMRNDSSGAAYLPGALRSNAFRLIESEVMKALPPAFSRFLIKVSLIEHLAPDLLGEITNDPELIKEMEGIRSFIRFDPDLNSYRIHNLFLDYLRERQHELSCEEKKEVFTKTARWCAANNRKTDAIINYEKTGDYDGIINVLNTLPMVLPTATAGFIFELLERLPESARREHPRIISVRARALISLARYEQAGTELLEALPQIKALPENSEKHRTLLACYMQLGFIGFIFSTYTKRYDFIHYFKMAAGESRLTDDNNTAPLNGISIGFHVCRVIDPSPEEMEKFIDMVREMVPFTAEAMAGCQYGMYELVQGEYAFFRSELGQAEKFLEKAVKMSKEKEQYEIQNRALFYLLRLYLARGNSCGVKNVLQSLEAELEMPHYYSRHFQYDIVTGWYYIQTGRKDLLAPWLKSGYEESELNSRSHGLEKLIKAKYYFAEKRYPAALASLENKKNLEIFIMGSVEMKSLEAVCRYKLADKEGAFKTLEEARGLASPAGLFMPFIELGKDMRSLAEAAIREKAPGLSPEWLEETRRGAASYAKKLYRQTERLGAEAEHARCILLSPRELNVLTGLSHGLTREEIAGSASISPNTVKSVTKSIYNKLGALNHADAVRIATERGLLS